MLVKQTHQGKMDAACLVGFKFCMTYQWYVSLGIVVIVENFLGAKFLVIFTFKVSFVPVSGSYLFMLNVTVVFKIHTHIPVVRFLLLLLLTSFYKQPMLIYSTLNETCTFLKTNKTTHFKNVVLKTMFGINT